MSSAKTIPPGSLVLVTGVTGFIGSHLANDLLQRGFRVRGTARDDTKASWISDFFHEQYGKDAFEVAVVPDMEAAGAYDAAIKGVSGVAHVASKVDFVPDPDKVIPGTLAGIRNILEAAASEPSVVRFVYTSSSTAAAPPASRRKFHVGSDSWNDGDIEASRTLPLDHPAKAYKNYSASKALGERLLWSWVREHQPAFVANSVLPCYTIGRLLHAKQLGSTAGLLLRMAQGSEQDAGFVRAIPPQSMVNVADIALLHIGALVIPEVQNQRLFGYADHYNFNSLVDAIKRVQPDNTTVPPKLSDEEAGEDWTTVETEPALKVLRHFGRSDWRHLDESVRELLSGTQIQ